MPNNRVLDVAKNIINISNDKGYKLSNLKLNNLLYIVQCVSYSHFGEPMFVEEMRACENGAKMYNVYVRYLGYGASNIPKETDVQQLAEEDMTILKGIVDVYANVDVWQLIEIVKKTTPWEFTWDVLNKALYIDYPIKNDFFKNSFREDKDIEEF